jgi:hypothetical protein
MGLLDDAIREHLDLKRRRGADPAEIERAEQEALGPVRRDPILSEDAADSVGAEPGGALAAAPEGEAELGAEHLRSEYDSERLTPEFDDERSPAEDDEWDDYDEDYGEDDELESAGPEAASQATTRPGISAHEAPPERPAFPPDPDDEELGDTASFDVEPGSDRPDQQQEDVLEETPEFLQDTPDHDRLWFEQRPPRDFDFDE